MSLADYTPETAVIEHRGKPLMEVRGLSLDDLAALIRDHLESFRQLSDAFGSSRSEIFARVQTEGFVLEVISKFPALAVSVIARCAGQPDMRDKITALPLGLQIKALQHIIRITVEDIGGPKAFVALVMEMTRTV